MFCAPITQVLNSFERIKIKNEKITYYLYATNLHAGIFSKNHSALRSGS